MKQNVRNHKSKLYADNPVAMYCGITLLLAIFITFLISSLTLLTEFSIDRWIFPVSVVLSMIISAFMLKLPIKRIMLPASVILAIIAVSVTASRFILDYSFDGNFYHQETVARLMQGWNPIYDNVKIYTLWTIHYAKGIEIIEAAIGSTMDCLEAGKAVNFLFIAAAFFIVYVFLKANYSIKKRLAAVMITLMIVGNPVAMAQSITFYIDYAKYYYFILLIIFFADIARNNSPVSKILASCVIILAVATKFNIFFETGVLVILTIIWLLIRHDYKASISIISLSFISLLAALALTYHPYFTNWTGYGNPFFPLMGDGTVEIISKNTPDAFTGNRFVDFFISIFQFGRVTYDARFGGFGIFMPFLLILSIIAVIAYWKRIRGIYKYIFICAFVSCFFFETSWWARYICQLWLLPCVAFLGIYSLNMRNAVILRKSLLIFSVLSAIYALGCTLGSSYISNASKYAIYEIKRDKNELQIINPTYQLIMKYREEGLNAKEVDIEEVDLSDCVYYCLTGKPEHYPIIVMTEDEMRRYDEYMRRLHIPEGKFHVKSKMPVP